MSYLVTIEDTADLARATLGSVEAPAEAVLVCTSQQGQFDLLCSCGHHTKIATTSRVFAETQARRHLIGVHRSPVDPFEGLS